MKTWSNVPLVPVSWGELIDKITILEIKNLRIQDEHKLKNIEIELSELSQVLGDMSQYPNGLLDLKNALMAINLELWDVEDGKRECERQKRFDDSFVTLARKVYFGNDERARIKSQINQLLGSEIVEEKSHKAY